MYIFVQCLTIFDHESKLIRLIFSSNTDEQLNWKMKEKREMTQKQVCWRSAMFYLIGENNYGTDEIS